ncbi:MAG: DUF1648 domain-containing protein [Terracidiphilus sp.]|jgi:hypothetical protein
MRKPAELLSLAALAALAFITINVFYGPHPLPSRIPTHFDALGNVNGWGSTQSLLFFPVFAAAMYLLLTAVSGFPAKFNYPVKVTGLNRAQLQQLALSLLASIKAELLVFLAWMEFAMVQAARSPERTLKPYPVAVFVAILFATIIGHIVAMFRATKSRQ